MISPEAYIERRLDDQINWYDRKSGANQLWFKRLRFAEIVAAAIIPFLSGFAGGSLPIKIAIGALGVVVAVIASLLALLRLQEHWISHRATAEALKTEKFLFVTQTQPYNTVMPSISWCSASKLCCQRRALSGSNPSRNRPGKRTVPKMYPAMST